MSMTNDDIVIVGAGHNGLVTADYLAKAGKKVLVLERREIAGGQLATRRVRRRLRRRIRCTPARQLRPDIVRDLDLARHGLARSRQRARLIVDACRTARTLRLTARRRRRSDARLDPATSRQRDAARWPEFVAFMNSAAAFLDAAYRTPMPRLPNVAWRTEGLPLASSSR